MPDVCTVCEGFVLSSPALQLCVMWSTRGVDRMTLGGRVSKDMTQVLYSLCQTREYVPYYDDKLTYLQQVVPDSECVSQHPDTVRRVLQPPLSTGPPPTLHIPELVQRSHSVEGSLSSSPQVKQVEVGRVPGTERGLRPQCLALGVCLELVSSRVIYACCVGAIY